MRYYNIKDLLTDRGIKLLITAEHAKPYSDDIFVQDGKIYLSEQYLDKYGFTYVRAPYITLQENNND